MPTPEILSALGLSAWLLVASISDVRARRIPNWVVGGGMVCGLVLQVLAPAGSGLFSFWWGGIGLGWSLLGMLTGLALFLPLYVLRILGAGDVKLLAMVGVWLGPQLLLGATLLTLLIGGVLAVAMMLASGSVRNVLSTVRLLLTTFMVGAHAGKLTSMDLAVPSGVRLPYALAIGLGTLAQIGWMLVHAAP
jgi:prepilin peptidase CpaA